jgi:hypothetical protein
MFSLHRLAAATAVAAALCVPATAVADDWYRTGTPAPVTQERITPDARDSGQPIVTVPAPPRVRIVEVPRTGFEWGDAAIGGAAALAAVLLLAGVAMTVRLRRTPA